jgi:hypothetical protein
MVGIIQGYEYQYLVWSQTIYIYMPIFNGKITHAFVLTIHLFTLDMKTMVTTHIYNNCCGTAYTSFCMIPRVFLSRDILNFEIFFFT